MSTVGKDDEDPSQIFSQQAVALQDEDGSEEEVAKEDGNGKDGSTPDMQGPVASLATPDEVDNIKEITPPLDL